jgi:hypothetical protein
MKRIDVGLGFWLVVALMAVMIGAMWLQRRTGCAVPFEGARILDLTRSTDREHLAIDLMSARRIATGDAACETRLLQQIATAHGLSHDQMMAPVAGAQ